MKTQEYKSIILTSKGIGKQYTSTIESTINKYKGKETNETYRTETGHKISMPIYWRNKIYNEEERELLWLNRLDKKEMWVMGEKIDVSNGYEQYDELQKYYRRINTRMGYGNNDRNQERKEYENTRRNIIMKERIRKEWGKMKTEENKKYNKKGKEEKMEEIEKIWKYGYMWKGNEKNGKIENYVNTKTVNYIIKYVSKKDEQQ